MRHGFVMLITILFLGLAVSPTSFANDNPLVTGSGVLADDQVLPWPWAMQCQFPWEDIDGNWLVTATQTSGQAEDRFEFQVEYVGLDGTRYFEVKRFDQNGNLRSRGRGFSAESVKIIRVAMIELDNEGKSIGRNYWAIVGAYQENRERTCGAGDLTTVVTVRTIGGHSQPSDVHYVVSKAPVDGVDK